MSQRTFCDRCGKECGPPRRSVAHLAEVHLTSDGQVAGEDAYKPSDLCDICTDVVKAGLGPALRMAENYPADSDEMRVQDRLVMLPELPRGQP
jgi:hypothetical protein